MSCHCDPKSREGYPYDQWIGDYFGDCVYTPLEHLAFALGFIAMIFFIFSMFPQFYKNYKRKSVRGLSIGFLWIECIGDLCNYFGAVFTSQFITVQYLGIYFVFIGIFGVVQYYWYKFKKQPITGIEEDDFLLGEGERPLYISVRSSARRYSMSILCLLFLSLLVYLNTPHPSEDYIGFDLLWEKTKIMTERPLCNHQFPMPHYLIKIGIFLSWFSGLFHCLSRIPQLFLNYQLKNVKGISLSLFVSMIIGNFCYGLQIVLRKEWLDHFWLEVPFLLGSFGAVIFDLMILGQFLFYRPRKLSFSSISSASFAS